MPSRHIGLVVSGSLVPVAAGAGVQSVFTAEESAQLSQVVSDLFELTEDANRVGIGVDPAQ